MSVWMHCVLAASLNPADSQGCAVYHSDTPLAMVSLKVEMSALQLLALRKNQPYANLRSFPCTVLFSGTLSRSTFALQLLALPEDEQLETLQTYMLSAAAEAAGIDELDPDQPLLELGLDSLRAAEFAVQVRLLPFSRPFFLVGGHHFVSIKTGLVLQSKASNLYFSVYCCHLR